MDPNHILQLATLACIQDLIGAKKILVQLYCIMVDNNPDGGQSQDQWVMEDKLQRIRQQVNSKLDNQKKLALILSAVEENIDEQGNVRSPVTYVVSFLSLLDECITDDKIIDDSLATSTAYFLDLVFPFTPKLLLKSKFSQILTKLATPLTHPDADAPLVRSTIGAVETLLLAQDHQQWTSKGNVSPKRAFSFSNTCGGTYMRRLIASEAHKLIGHEKERQQLFHHPYFAVDLIHNFRQLVAPISDRTSLR